MAVIFHLDLDAFFVSVERILNPALEGKPVIVGGDPHGRGVVAACSYEARAFGLHSAMPIGEAFRLCPQGIYLHGHYEEYIRFSRLVEELLIGYAPVIQQASIDEFYMDFSGCEKLYGPSLGLAHRIQKDIFNKLHLPCSIGIAGNKTVAKIASDFNKPLGITYVLPGCEGEFLSMLPISVIPGVGKVIVQKLHDKGFYLVKDIAKMPLDYFSSSLGKSGIDLWHKANGEGTEFLSPGREAKSISKETTFGEDVLDKNKLKDVLFDLNAKVCQNLRDDGFLAATVTLKLRYTDFETLTRAKTIPFTNDDRTIYETAVNLFEKAYTRRVAIRLIGIGVSKFAKIGEQMTLFNEGDRKRNELLNAVNQIRDKYGFSKILLGVVDENQKSKHR